MVYLLIFLIILVLGISIAWGVAGVYNVLVTLSQNVKNGFSQIDVQLKRRHDLISNLVENVKGYAKHESQTLENVIKARNQAVNAKSVDEKRSTENMLTSTLKTLFAVSENYPELKADNNFLELQKEITSTENRISITRESYNDQVARLNTSILTFPTNLIAKQLGFVEAIYFETNDSDKEVPEVKF